MLRYIIKPPSRKLLLNKLESFSIAVKSVWENWRRPPPVSMAPEARLQNMGGPQIKIWGGCSTGHIKFSNESWKPGSLNVHVVTLDTSNVATLEVDFTIVLPHCWKIPVYLKWCNRYLYTSIFWLLTASIALFSSNIVSVSVGLPIMFMITLFLFFFRCWKHLKSLKYY